MDRIKIRRVLQMLCWAGGIGCALGVVGLFLPKSLFHLGHDYLVGGDFPDSPVAMYLARITPGLYMSMGVILCVCGTDPVRYRPIVITVGVLFLLLAILVMVGGPMWGLPAMFYLGDGLTAGPFGLLLAVLAGKLRK